MKDQAVTGVAARDRVCSGRLSSSPGSRHIHINSIALSFGAHNLLIDSNLELNHGRRYGLVGPNGCGKSTLLRAIACRELPIPRHMDIHYLSCQIEASGLSAWEYVTSCVKETEELDKEATLLENGDGDGEALQHIFERLDALQEDCENRAAEIWYGLGFEKQMQSKKAEDFSGGWRMKLALARALFINPKVLLLDEPTNQLDLKACLWLGDRLKKYEQILVFVSNSQDFLNEVSSDIIHMENSVLRQYNVPYDQYAQTLTAVKQKIAYQAQSKHKTSAKMMDRAHVFHFTDAGEELIPPILQLTAVKFGYQGDNNLVFEKLDFELDLKSRVAVIGPTGAGKSTLLNLLTGDLAPVDGRVGRNSHLRIALFHQGLVEKLDPGLSAIEHMMYTYPDNEKEKLIATIANFGLSETQQITPMRNLSDGQRSRVVFASLAFRRPHMMLLDNPTDHLDTKAVDSLAKALKKWNGGLVVVSNDFRLINLVAPEIMVCGSQGIIRQTGNIMELKQHLKSRAENMRSLRNLKVSTQTYPQFAVSHFAEVALSSVCYEQYIDGDGESYRDGCIPIKNYLKRVAMVANAPCSTLREGNLEIPGEFDLTERYRMSTESGKKVARFLLKRIHEAEAIDECFGDFDCSNIVITPSGEVQFKRVKRKILCPVQLRKSHMSAHKIIKDMFSENGAVPEDIQFLLDMIEHEPEMSPIYHIHASLLPLCMLSPFYIRMYEHIRKCASIAVRDAILVQIPYLSNWRTDWKTLVQTSELLMQTYDFKPGLYNLPELLPLPGRVAVTAQQKRDRLVKEALDFLDFLRHRIAHRMDYLQQIQKYIAEGSDLACQARFSLVSCVMQKELFKAKGMAILNLEQFF